MKIKNGASAYVALKIPEHSALVKFFFAKKSFILFERSGESPMAYFHFFDMPVGFGVDPFLRHPRGLRSPMAHLYATSKKYPRQAAVLDIGNF